MDDYCLLNIKLLSDYCLTSVEYYRFKNNITKFYTIACNSF